MYHIIHFLYSVGDFTPIRPKEDQCILELMKHIPVRAGDLVCWDYRIGELISI